MTKRISYAIDGEDNGVEYDSLTRVPEYFDIQSAAKLCGVTTQAISYWKRVKGVPHIVKDGKTMIERDNVYKMRAAIMDRKLRRVMK